MISTLLSSDSVNNSRYAAVGEENGHLPDLERAVSFTSSGSGQHCHDRDVAEQRLDKRAMKKLIFAIVLCLIFMCAEIVGGVLSRSLAIATDAAHLLTDLISFVISLFAIYIGSRAPTKRMSFGYYRAEVMGALVSVLLIWVVTAVLVYLAIQRIITNQYEIDAVIMLITSGLAIVFNLIMACSLGHNHSHGVGGSHSHDIKPPPPSNSAAIRAPDNEEEHTLIDKENQIAENEDSAAAAATAQHSHGGGGGHSHRQNINVRAAMIHVIGDFIQSIGIFAAALVIYFKPEWKIVDPICTFLFSVLVIFTTVTILKDTLNVLMEGLPQGMDFNDVKQSLISIQGVKEVHNLRIWSLTVNKCALAVHLALDRSVNGQLVVAESSRMMRERYGINECTIQVEDYVDEMDDCTQCRDPRD